MAEINLGSLALGPHATLIREIADKCINDENIEAIWVGGSLAAEHGDIFSDIDFRIAVKPGQVSSWIKPNWEQYLPLLPYGNTFMKFGEHALLHHLVLADGTILDFFVQDTEHQNFEPKIVVLACRDTKFGKKLEEFSRPAAKLVNEIDGAELRQFFVDYWIVTHKELKALARQYDLSPFVGLYWERLALLRAYYIQATGKNISSHATLHMLAALHKGLEDKMTERQKDILGLPSRTPQETIIAVEAIRGEMARIGRHLSNHYAFSYPHELEDVVQSAWNKNREAILKL